MLPGWKGRSMRLFYRITTTAANRIDTRFGTNFKERGGVVYRLILRELSPLRRIVDPLVIRFWYRYAKKPADLKLHLGCGWKRFDGYINADLHITDATDVICDVTRLPWPDGSAAVVESHHVIEHISHTKVADALADWHRLLCPGGRLVLECPHFDQAISEYLSGNEDRLLNIFGRQRFPGDAHLFGYTPERLARMLREAGFSEITEKNPQSSQSADEPSFRIECVKR